MNLCVFVVGSHFFARFGNFSHRCKVDASAVLLICSGEFSIINAIVFPQHTSSN